MAALRCRVLLGCMKALACASARRESAQLDEALCQSTAHLGINLIKDSPTPHGPPLHPPSALRRRIICHNGTRWRVLTRIGTRAFAHWAVNELLLVIIFVFHQKSNGFRRNALSIAQEASVFERLDRRSGRVGEGTGPLFRNVTFSHFFVFLFHRFFESCPAVRSPMPVGAASCAALVERMSPLKLASFVAFARSTLKNLFLRASRRLRSCFRRLVQVRTGRVSAVLVLP